MRLRSYKSELQKSLAQLLDVFNNIVIDRRDENSVQKLISVPCVYGNRSRILKSLENRNKTLSLPLTCITMGNITRDPSRTFGIHDGMFSVGSTNNYINNTPVPVNITYEYNIITKFQEDLDMIISNWAVWFLPDIYVTIPISLVKKLKCQIVWDENLSISYPSEINDEQPARFVATTNFTFKTYLFPGLDGVESTENLIYEIIEDWHAVPQILTFDDYYSDVLSGNVTSAFFDHLHLSSHAQPASGYIPLSADFCLTGGL